MSATARKIAEAHAHAGALAGALLHAFQQAQIGADSTGERAYLREQWFRARTHCEALAEMLDADLFTPTPEAPRG